MTLRQTVSRQLREDLAPVSPFTNYRASGTLSPNLWAETEQGGAPLSRVTLSAAHTYLTDQD